MIEQLNHLPEELIATIFGWLESAEIHTCSHVCSLWRRIAQDSSVWCRLVQRDFPDVWRSGQDWKQLYLTQATAPWRVTEELELGGYVSHIAWNGCAKNPLLALRQMHQPQVTICDACSFQPLQVIPESCSAVIWRGNDLLLISYDWEEGSSLLSLWQQGEVALRKTRTWEMPHSSYIDRIFYCDEQRLILRTLSHLIVYSFSKADGEILRELQIDSDRWYGSTAVSQEGRFIAMATDSALHLYDMEHASHSTLYPGSGEDPAIEDLAFVNSGKALLLVVIGREGTVNIYRVQEALDGRLLEAILLPKSVQEPCSSTWRASLFASNAMLHVGCVQRRPFIAIHRRCLAEPMGSFMDLLYVDYLGRWIRSPLPSELLEQAEGCLGFVADPHPKIIFSTKKGLVTLEPCPKEPCLPIASPERSDKRPVRALVDTISTIARAALCHLLASLQRP